MDSKALEWIRTNWRPDLLPNNMWIAVVASGMIGQAATLEALFAQLNRDKLDNIVFCYATFGVWQ
jgi:hypothetical protein